MTRAHATLLCLLMTITAGSALAEDWPAFRGPAGDGAVREAAFPGEGELGLRVAWKRPLGSGYSSVSVAGAKLVTMFSDGSRDYLIALDRATGHEHWRFDIGETHIGHDGSHTGPSSTPLISEGRVYALGPRGRLVASSLADGTVHWSVELIESAGARKPHYGFSTAPLLADGVLVVQTGGDENRSIAGLDPASGETLWTLGEDTIQYQSPIPLSVGERTLVMAAGDKKLLALDPASGEILWEFEHEGDGARGVGSLMPVLAGSGRVFLAHKDNASRMLRIGHADEEITFEPLWENRAIRNSYNIPIYHDDHIYAFSSRFLTCVDAETGETLWKSRAPGDGFLMLVGEHLVIQTKEGSLHLAEATPEGYREVSAVELFDELAWSPPAFSAGSIFVRSLGQLARVDVARGERTLQAHAGGRLDLSGSELGAMLERVAAADDRQAVVDEYLEAQTSFPVVEEGGLVHFLHASDAADVALGGDMIGSRQEVPMTRVDGTNLFYRSMRLEPDARVAYVFIEDFERELIDPRNPNSHMSTVYGKDMEMIFNPANAIWMSTLTMPEWRAPDHLAEVAAERRGSAESHQVESATLGRPVALTVHLPAGYAADSESGYPVAYVYGGSTAMQVGKLDDTLDNLLGDRVGPVILAFVDAPMPPFQMAQYGEVLATEVVPFMDENYRTRPDREHRASVGAGFPGYGAMFAAFSQPDTFGQLGAQSPLMLDSMREPLEAILPMAADAPLEIYMDWGKYDMRNPHENWDLARDLRRFTALLRERGYEPMGGEAHDGAGWSSYKNRTDDLLETLFPAASGGQ